MQAVVDRPDETRESYPLQAAHTDRLQVRPDTVSQEEGVAAGP